MIDPFGQAFSSLFWLPHLPEFIRLLYCAGATHEMMREDRDEFVKILEENLSPNSTRNFKRTSGDEYSSQNTPFDYRSVMMPLD